MRGSRSLPARRAVRWVRSSQVLGLAVEPLEVRRLLTAITVTGTGDTIAADGVVTLREAITAANTNAPAGDAPAGSPGLDSINFNIGGAGVKTINLTAALPTIVDPVSINGYTQGTASANTLANADNAVILVELDGAAAGAAADGLVLGAGSGGSTVRGLVVNRFAGDGIVLRSDGNTVAGNFVGVDPTGTTRMPNGTFPVSGDGIRIENASNNQIGGTSPADRNIASGNAIDGIHVVGSRTAPAGGNLIQGNFVGVAADGKSPVGNRTEPAPAPGAAEGNNLFGIEISGGDNNTVGGTVAGARNVVGFNGAGIEVDNGGQGNVIQGNFSGVGADGVTPAGNLLHGIVLRSSNGFGAPLGPPQPNEPGVSFNLVGGTAAGAGNLVEFNGTAGIAVFGNPVAASGQPNIGNAILGNSVYLNGRSNPTALLGIDLTNGFTFPKDDGLTPNDSKGHGAPNDPNNFQNFPVLTSANPDSGGTGTKVTGTLKSAPNSTYRVEFFASDPDPAGGIPEGQEFLGFVDVTTDASGHASFSPTLGVPVAAGRVVTATATDGTGNTSEFSAPRTVVSLPTLSVNDVKLTEGNSGLKNFTFTVTRAGDTSGASVVHFSTANGTASSASDYILKSGTLTFATGQITKTVTVQVRGDTTVEGNETFFLNLFAPTGATIADGSGKGTILNDDTAAPKVSVSVNDESDFEGNSGLRPITFKVWLDQASTKTVTVHYATANGTAAAGSDYNATSGTVTFAAGQTQKMVTVYVKGDTVKEPDETFFVNLSSPINAVIAKGQGKGVIKNDD
ncbi:MAG TPA: Calx-beta domain-containing protein [Gemmataceae bacterium]|nr:Calx-beta domain-containing protein [Gemmataceae bacterium]